MAELTVEQRTGTAATIGALAAVASIVLSFAARPGWGIALAIVGLIAGGIGLLMAASPRVGGGMLSVGAIILSIFAVGLGVIVAAGAIVL